MSMEMCLGLFTCGEAISDKRRRSTSRFSPSSSPSSNRQILAILIKLLLLIDTRRLENSRDMWLPGNCDFLGNVTSRKLWLPRKYDFRGNLTTWEVQNHYFAGKCGFFGNLTSRELLIPRKYDFTKCEFLENVNSWKICLSGIVNSLEIWFIRKL